MQSPKVLFALALALGAGTAAKAETARLDEQKMFVSGEDAYKKVCARCHTGVDSTVGPDLLDGAHDRDILEYFVRNGSGPMPAFTHAMIDDATLDGIAAYVAENSKESQE